MKAQVPTGKRGKAGGIKTATGSDEVTECASQILGIEISGHRVERLLVEQQCQIELEYYAAVLNDPDSKCPLMLFSPHGGMEVEEIAATHPDAIYRHAVDIRAGFDKPAALAMLRGAAVKPGIEAIAEVLAKLYEVYRENDAELVEINPLALTKQGELMALDCKFVLDDSSIKRREELAACGVPEPLSDLEARAQVLGFKYVDLDGEIGVLANGAGLTMTTMDVIQHYGGRPANFLEIGGDAYTLAKPALSLLLTNPRIRCLVVKLLRCVCAYRCDGRRGGRRLARARSCPARVLQCSWHRRGAGGGDAARRARSRAV